VEISTPVPFPLILYTIQTLYTSNDFLYGQTALRVVIWQRCLHNNQRLYGQHTTQRLCMHESALLLQVIAANANAN